MDDYSAAALGLGFFASPWVRTTPTRRNDTNAEYGFEVRLLSDVFFKMSIPHDGKKAAIINKLIFETIYFGALEASMELAKEKGAYSSFKGSPLSEGKFQFDLWSLQNQTRWIDSKC